MINLDKHELDIACPQCGQKTKKPIGWLKTNPQLTCLGCGTAILINADQLRTGIDGVQKAIDNLRSSFKGFGE